MTRIVRLSLTAATLALLALSLAVSHALSQEIGEVRFEQLSKGHRFTEGPAWSKDGYLIFSDTSGDQLFKWTPGSAVAVFRGDAHGPAGNAFDAQGRLYTCETRTRRVTRTDKTGKIEILADKWEGHRFNAPTGIAAAKSGHVYFTDPAFGEQADHRELDFYGVYHIPPKGPITLIAKSATRPRGITVSANGRTLYVTNADEHNIRTWDLDHNGDASNERILVTNTTGAPGGIAIDESGNLWVANQGVQVYSPAGKLIHAIEMKEPFSNGAFGDLDGKTLFLTSRGIVFRARPEPK
jgi:gluconolactonase